MCTETLYVAGRYNKYLRNLSQSPWFNDDIKIKNSVQELIEEGLKEYITFDKSVFSSSGREDVDVRMLGNGRPFVFKLTNPFNPLSYTDETMEKIEQFVNSKHAGKIKIRDLQIVDKAAVAKNIKDGQESKTKEYRALCCCSRKVLDRDLDRISQVRDLNIDQKTPIRVLHRRTQMTRRRKILSLKAERVKLGEFGSAHEGNLDKLMCLNLVTEAGTYIKEFVHGDFGRTEPCLGELLDGVDTDLMELDVMGVYTDWPPQVTRGHQITTDSDTSVNDIHQAQMDDKSEVNLHGVYNEALKAMRDAEAMPRGDDRQSLYMKARHLFEKARDLVEELSLFSSNESHEDISTTDLKYLLIDAHLSKISVSCENSTNPANRLVTLARAESYAKSFLRQALNYGLVSKEIEFGLVQAGDGDSRSFSSNLSAGSTSLEAAKESRIKKIEKYKKMKVLETRLEELSKRFESSDGDCKDDETARDYYMSLINKSIEDCFDSLMNEIKPALNFERNRPQLEDEARKEEQPPSRKPVNQPQRPLTIVKNELQKQVFGVGYPAASTVTVDEFIGQKIKSGELAFQAHKEIYGNSLQRYAEKPDLLKEQEEQSDAEHDEKEERDEANELERRRRWDEFKDENPRGSGNRHNRG